jgi:hypothetical protein
MALGFSRKAKEPANASEKEAVSPRFAISKSAIREMYKGDETVVRNVNKTTNSSSSVYSTDLSVIKNNYHTVGGLETVRRYSQELFAYSPIYQRYIEYLSNMFLWRYMYVPRPVKERATSADYGEVYEQMGEAVDGMSIETSFPATLCKLFIEGAVFIYTWRNTASRTLTSLLLPSKYCRVNAQTQFGCYTYQFDLSYFDNLGLTAAQLEEIFNYYPKELKLMYEAYKADTTNMRWQLANPKVAGAILLNSKGTPTIFNSIFPIRQYDQYMDNELERNGQQLDRIITHEMPTWEDKLIVDIPEMKELHSSMSKVLSKNSHVRLLTSFGKIDVRQLSQDSTKENKTLENAYKAIYDNLGSNNYLFNGSSDAALKYSLTVEQSFVWNYVQQLVALYNVFINNSFNFSGYQCDLQMLPLTGYNEQEMLTKYKEGATLGIAKLEYAVAFGNKQVNLASKFALEDYLKLDKLKPLSTSYTQNDNSKQDGSNNKSNKTEQEVNEKDESSN